MEEIIHGVSGGISGVVAISVWYPLDIIRLREQAELLDKSTDAEVVNQIETNTNEGLFNYIKNLVSKKIRSLDFAKNLINREGIKTLYKGMSSAFIGMIITYFIYFTAYKYFKNLLIKNNFTKGVIIDSLITSFLAACASSIGSNPIWVLNTRMAKAKKEHENLTNFDMIKQILREEGISGFFKGLVPALILTVNPVIQFAIYEFMRLKLLDSKGNISGLNIIIISIVSKLITTIITYPILTVKTLFQANDKKSNNEIIDILKNLIKKEGLGGLFKGINAKIIQTLLNNVILMLTYEKIQAVVKIIFVFILMNKNKRLVKA
jgi:adenine nucleotide transporter 17